MKTSLWPEDPKLAIAKEMFKLALPAGHALPNQTKLAALEFMADPIAHAIEAMTHSLMANGKILACGNGGSAADAQHFAAELLNRFELQQNDVIEYRMNRIRKEYRTLLSEEAHYGDREMLEILRRMLNTANYKTDKKLVEKMQDFIEWTRKNSTEDAVIIDYGNWLNTKLTK